MRCFETGVRARTTYSLGADGSIDKLQLQSSGDKTLESNINYIP
jgi:hypothetical protein